MNTTTLPHPPKKCVMLLQDALASFDFLNKRNSIAVKSSDLDRLDKVAEQEIQPPGLELTAIQKEIR